MNPSGSPALRRDPPAPPARDAWLAADHIRGPGRDLPGCFKEWMHFCLFDGECQVLVNLGLQWELPAEGRPATPRPHAVLLARSHGAWSGFLESFRTHEAGYRAGSLDLRTGNHALSYREGRYRLRMDSPRHGLRLECDLTPTTRPFTASSVLLDGGRTLKWCAVPALRVEGLLEGPGFRHLFRRAPAYHDHNWGSFLWGGDYAWEWAAFTPPGDDGVAAVYSRITDAARSLVLSQSLLLWRGGNLRASFAGSALRVNQAGLLPPSRPLRLPPAMRLAAEGCVFDLPARIEIEASDASNRMRLAFTLSDGAEVAVPSETLAGAAVLSEMHAAATLEWKAGSSAESWGGPALVEFNRAAR